MKKLCALLLAVLLTVSLAACGYQTQNQDSTSVPTEEPTRYAVTPCTDEETQQFAELLVGTWSSYNTDGIAYSYQFFDDGTVLYQKDGEDDKHYTYTIEGNLFTIISDEKNFVYQCSKDAVGMMATLNYGEYHQLFYDMGEEIEDFNGCVYISDDFMHLGTVCLCRQETLTADTERSLVGNWLGVVGDTINFGTDGSYVYLNNAETYRGKYTVDFDQNKLNLSISGQSTDYDETGWGLDGRVLHIGKQYYFRT